jgi:hypothetical protein
MSGRGPEGVVAAERRGDEVHGAEAQLVEDGEFLGERDERCDVGDRRRERIAQPTAWAVDQRQRTPARRDCLRSSPR